MNTSQSFKSFVKRQNDQSVATSSIDYATHKKEYIEHLDALYIQMRSYLREFIEAGSVRLEASIVQLNEEGIGPYDAPRFTVIIGAQHISFTPIGTLIIGSKGRVDVTGSVGKARLGLVDRRARDIHDVVKVTVHVRVRGKLAPEPEPPRQPQEVDWTWKIWSPPPSMTFIDLDRDSFFAMLLEVSGG